MEKDNHHFIPQGYLRKFTILGEKSLIWEYDKKEGFFSKKPKSVRKICAIKQYYAQEDEQGNINKNNIEDAFSKYTESPGIRVINSIPKTVKSSFKLSQDERAALAFFLALLATRGPIFRDAVKNIHKKAVELVGESVIHELLKNGEVPDVVKKQIEKNGVLGTVKFNVKNWVSLRPMIDMAHFGAIVLLRKKWDFVQPSQKKYFVTSDNPYVFNAPEDVSVGPFHPLANITIPLRKDIAFIASSPVEHEEEEFTITKISEEETKELNSKIIEAAMRYVFTPIKDDLILRAC